jgi:hypothetical protein
MACTRQQRLTESAAVLHSALAWAMQNLADNDGTATARQTRTPMSYLDIAQSLQDSKFGLALRESQIAFPVVEGIHLLGLALSFGLLLFVDLRLLGLIFEDLPFEDVVQPLRRWLYVGFSVTFLSGALLFWADAGDLVRNTPFLIKSVLIVLALANAIVFDLRFVRHLADREGSLLSGPAVRTAGGLSLGLWALVTIAGRLIPYYSAH